MKKPVFRIATAAFVIAIIGAILLLAPPVSAQESGPTPTPAIASTPMTTAAQVTTPTPPVMTADQLLPLVMLVLVSTILWWAILFIYTGWIQGRYFDATVSLARAGVLSIPTVVGSEPFTGEKGFLATATLQVKGPGVVTVGVQSSEFTSTRQEGGSEPISATWEVDPSNAALVVPHAGSAVKVIAAISGVFKLTAKAPNDGPSATVEVAAIAPQPLPGKVELPAFGRGYGSIAVAVVVLAVVIVLGLSRILPDAAIATLLGALVGYLFNSRASTPPSTPSGAPAPTSE